MMPEGQFRFDAAYESASYKRSPSNAARCLAAPCRIEADERFTHGVNPILRTLYLPPFRYQMGNLAGAGHTSTVMVKHGGKSTVGSFKAGIG